MWMNTALRWSQIAASAALQQTTLSPDNLRAKGLNSQRAGLRSAVFLVGMGVVVWKNVNNSTTPDVLWPTMPMMFFACHPVYPGGHSKGGSNRNY